MAGPDDDDSLMAAAGAGDRGAFGQLVARHYPAAWRVAARLARDAGRAADLVQATFLKVLERAADYRPEGKFPAWLRVVMTRLAIDEARRARPEPVAAPEVAAPPSTDPAVRAEAADLAARLARALGALPGDQRAALVLRAYEGLSYAAVAAALDTTPKAVEMLLRRARTALLVELGHRPVE